MELDFIRMKMIGDYIFADELLSVVIVAHFFPVENFPKRFKDKKMRTFMHFVMEELFMVRKLALVKEIRLFDCPHSRGKPDSSRAVVDRGS